MRTRTLSCPTARQSVLGAGIFLAVLACTEEPVAPSHQPTASLAEQPHHCRPTGDNHPVCPQGARPGEATFLDPTVRVVRAGKIKLGQRVYVGPFARLIAKQDAEIVIGEESNLQDNVAIFAAYERDAGMEGRLGRIGLDENSGVEIAERVILAHGATVKGPAKLGIGGGDIIVDPDDDQEVFLSFGTEVDGAILERNTGISALGRVGPGVILRSGLIVLPGKNVARQSDAGTFASPGPKVRLLTEADVAFNEAVLEVNVAFAREYTRLYYQNPSNVRGINFDPGNTAFNPNRDLPKLAGVPTRAPGFRNRIIGEVDLADNRARLSRVMADRISIRADEGEPFEIGHIALMRSNVIFHALEETPILAGDNVSYGVRAIVHGGGRDPIAGGGDTQETILEDDVVLRAYSVVFRSLIGKGSTIGYKSAVVASRLAPGTRIPARTVIVNNAEFGPVEW